MGVVDEAVENGVRQGGVLHRVIPGFQRKLTGNDGCLAIMALFNDFQKFLLLILAHGGDEKVVEDQDFCLGDLPHDLGVATVMSGDRDILEERLGDRW